MIGRTVTARVERVLWRRPNAPEPPRRFRFNDWGWSGDLENKRPLRVCGVTRMKLGRRYLAPVARQHGEWFPFPETRLRLRGDLVVGAWTAAMPRLAPGPAGRLVSTRPRGRTALPYAPWCSTPRAARRTAGRPFTATATGSGVESTGFP